MNTIKRFRHCASFCLLVALALSAASCGDAAATDGTSESDNASTLGEESAPPKYDYPALDLNGDEFTILNTSQTYGFFSSLDFDESTGEKLNDSIYDRNRALEDRYNFKFVIMEEELQGAADALQNSVLSQEDLYDVAFLRDYYLSNLITENYLVDLDGVPELRLDEAWWDGDVTEQSRVGKNGKALVAATDVSLVDFEGTMVTFFNEDKMNALGLELPYAAAEEGKWTFDKLLEYSRAAASLNGDDDFRTYNPDGSAFYGITGFPHTYTSILASADVEFITKDSDDLLAFGLDNERFYTAATKISTTLTSSDGTCIWINDGKSRSHYETAFKEGRSLFTMAQLKAANNYRDMEATYGIVPIPKYDGSQSDYRNLRTFSYMMVIPVTNSRLSETGIIMDAISFITYDSIMPYFYEGRISQKILRNDESIAMMELIRDTRFNRHVR